MLKMMLAAAMFAIIAVAPTAADCGDCNGDGTVTVDEVLTTVNNALEGGGTLPPLPARCPTARPGDRIQAFGHQYVIVETLVTLEDSTRQYALRQPLRIQDGGALSTVIATQVLTRNCFGNEVICSEQRVQLCGFTSGQSISVGSGNAYYTEAPRAAGGINAGISASGGANGFLRIFVSPDHNPIYFSISDGGAGFTTTPTPVSSFGYSFVTANYTRPTPNPSWTADMRRLLETVSIRLR